jgi:thiol:disulfide interchange protein DsbD
MSKPYLAALLAAVLALALCALPAPAAEPASPAPEAAPSRPQAPEAQAPRPGLMLIPAVLGHPAGKATPLLFLWKLPQGADPGGEPLVELEGGYQAVEARVASPEGRPGMVALIFKVRVPADAQPGWDEVAGTARLPLAAGGQAEAGLTAPLKVLPPDGQTKILSPAMLQRLMGGEPQEVPQAAEARRAPPGALPPAAGSQAAAPAERSLWQSVRETVAGAFAGEGGLDLTGLPLWVVLVLAFLTGVALNATPCVYPLIPITVSFFGGRAQGSKAALAAGAGAYWAGLVAMYTALGAFAALTGSMLGQALTNPYVLVGIALVFLALAASMFGLWEIRMPAKLSQAAAANRTGLFGTFVMGLLVGVLAAPCVGPVVVGFIALVAKMGQLSYGLAVFFCLSLGLGLPLTVLAFFSGSLQRLPGAGDWMVWVRAFFGVVLVLMALYVVQPLLPPDGYFWTLAFLCLAGGVYLGFLQPGGGPKFRGFKRVVGVAFILLPGLLWAGGLGAPAPQADSIDWRPYSQEAVREARGRPMLVLFTADWCPPCKELKQDTFPDPEVQAALTGFATLLADVTQGPGPEAQRAVSRWGVRGVPTMVFLDAKGRRIPELDTVGFVPPDAFLERLRQAGALAGREE